MSISELKKGSILVNAGINVSIPAEYLDDHALRNSVNFDISRNLLQKRSGETVLGGVIGGTGIEIMSGSQYNREGTKYNVRVGLDKIERYNPTSDVWVDITGTDLTATTDDLHDIAIPLLSGKRILTISNGIDVIRKWNATGDVDYLGGTPPVAKFIQEYKTYLVCANIAGGTDITQRVQWSDTAAPETWTGGNSGAVDLVEDGGDITGMALYGDYLAIHKDSSIYLGYLVSTTAIFQFARKATGIGTIANNSIVNLPTGEQLFLAKNGVALFNGITVSLIPSTVNDEIRDEFNPEYAFKSWSVLKKDRDEVWIGIPIGGQTSGETVYKYNYLTKTLYKDTRTNATFAWVGSAADSKSWDDFTTTWDDEVNRWNENTLNEGSDQINIGHSDGYTTVVDTTKSNDNGAGIDAYIVTKDFQDSQQQMSRWKSLELWAKGGSVNVEYSIDGGNTWVSASNSPLSLDSNFPPYETPDVMWFDVTGSKIRFKFTNTSLTESLTIKQFVINYSKRELRSNG